MQINFYMSDEDRNAFHDYVFSRGGYIMPESWHNDNVPIITSNESEAIKSRILKIYKEDIFSKSNFENMHWITYQELQKDYFIHGPGMEYLTSFQDDSGIHRGRIYMGLVGSFSFVEPGKNDPDAYTKYKELYNRLENFYKSCCRYMRKNYRKDEAGFYHGPGSDFLVRSKGVAKLQI